MAGLKLLNSPIFGNEDNVVGLGSLRGNVLSNITVDYTVELEIAARASDRGEIVVGDTDYQTEDYMTRAGAFVDFAQGDEVEVVALQNGGTTHLAAGIYLVEIKVNDSTIKLVNSNGAPIAGIVRGSATSGTIRLNFEPQAVEVSHNFVENSAAPSFKSKITAQDIVWKRLGENTGAFTTTPEPLIPVNKKGAYTGGVMVSRNTDASGNVIDRRQWDIKHTLRINPYYLLNQENTLSNDIAPNYLKDGRSLRFVARVRFFPANRSQTRFFDVDVDAGRGAVGWFGTNYGEEPKFYLSEYNSSRPQNALYAGGVTTITAKINKVESNSDALSVWAHFILLPENESDIDNGFFMDENYLVDSIQIGGADSPRFGTGTQVFTDGHSITSTDDDANISVDIDFGADAIAKIEKLENRKFIIAFSPRHPATLPNLGDETLIRGPLSFVDVPPLNFVTVSTAFLLHDDKLESAVGYANPELQNNDEVVLKANIILDKTEFPDLKLQKIKTSIVAVNPTTLEEVVLDEIISDISSNGVAEGNVIGSVRQPSEFNVLDTEIRGAHLLERRSTLDTDADHPGYFLLFPFICRWEKWKELATSEGDFYDETEPNDGLNHEWSRLEDFAAWSLKAVVTVYAREAPDSQRILSKSFDAQFSQFDYLENPVWVSEEIKIFDAENVELAFLPENEEVTIEAHFTFNDGPVELETVDYGQLFIIDAENGDYKQLVSSSTLYKRGGISPLKSIDNPDGNSDLVQVAPNIVKVVSTLNTAELGAGNFQIVGKIQRGGSLGGGGFAKECFYMTPDNNKTITINSQAGPPKVESGEWYFQQLTVNGVDLLPLLATPFFTVEYETDYQIGAHQGPWDFPGEPNYEAKTYQGTNIAWHLKVVEILNSNLTLGAAFEGFTLREATFEEGENFHGVLFGYPADTTFQIAILYGTPFGAEGYVWSENGVYGGVNVNFLGEVEYYATPQNWFWNGSGYYTGKQNCVIDDGSGPTPPNYGCTNPDAENFDPDATDDNGSCTYAFPDIYADGVVVPVISDDADLPGTGFQINGSLKYDSNDEIIDDPNGVWDCVYEIIDDSASPAQLIAEISGPFGADTSSAAFTITDGDQTSAQYIKVLDTPSPAGRGFGFFFDKEAWAQDNNFTGENRHELTFRFYGVRKSTNAPTNVWSGAQNQWFFKPDGGAYSVQGQLARYDAPPGPQYDFENQQVLGVTRANSDYPLPNTAADFAHAHQAITSPSFNLSYATYRSYVDSGAGASNYSNIGNPGITPITSIPYFRGTAINAETGIKAMYSSQTPGADVSGASSVQCRLNTTASAKLRDGTVRFAFDYAAEYDIPAAQELHVARLHVYSGPDALFLGASINPGAQHIAPIGPELPGSNYYPPSALRQPGSVFMSGAREVVLTDETQPRIFAKLVVERGGTSQIYDEASGFEYMIDPTYVGEFVLELYYLTF